MSKIEKISIDNLIGQLNDIADDCFLPDCKIMPIDDQVWWMRMVHRYDMEGLYEIISNGIHRGDFDWNHKYFRIDSETQEIKSFCNVDDIISFFGEDALEDLCIELNEIS